MTERALATARSTDLAPALEYSIDVNRVVAQTIAVQEVMARLMKRDEHFGVIPGTDKPSLWQPGADKLCLLFRLRPEFEIIATVESDLMISLTVRCRLYQIGGLVLAGEGIGSANSREKKFASQINSRLCPKCSAPAIIKGRQEYGGGWLCFAKKNGCGMKFKDGDKSIEAQTGEVQKDALWDLHNTIFKRACKRAKVSATLTATAASDIFSQDLEDLEEIEYIPPQEPESTRGKRQDKAAPRTVAAPQDDEPPPPTDEDAPPTDGAVDVVDHRTGVVKSVAKVSKAQLAKIHVLKAQGGWVSPRWEEELKKAYNVYTSADLSKDQATHWIEKLSRKQDAAEHALSAVGAELERLEEFEHCSMEQIQEIGVEFGRLNWKGGECSRWLMDNFKAAIRSELSVQQATSALQKLMVMPDGARP